MRDHVLLHQQLLLCTRKWDSAEKNVTICSSRHIHIVLVCVCFSDLRRTYIKEIDHWKRWKSVLFDPKQHICICLVIPIRGNIVKG